MSDTELEILRAENSRLKDMLDNIGWHPVRYKDRPPGFIETRKTVCTTPHLCFEFGEQAPVCGPCDTETMRRLHHV